MVSFDPPTADGAVTITIQAQEPNGATGYTSFTLQRDTTGSANPPVIGSLQNEAVPIDPNNHTATYETMFVIGDLGIDGAEEIGLAVPNRQAMLAKNVHNSLREFAILI